MTRAELLTALTTIRAAFEGAFSPETAKEGFGGVPSAGQCVGAAVYLKRRFGGEYVSAIVNGQSHWFNRIEADGEALDVDMTGDQFGRPAVQLAESGALYEGTRVRPEADLQDEARARAEALIQKAGL